MRALQVRNLDDPSQRQPVRIPDDESHRSRVYHHHEEPRRQETANVEDSVNKVEATVETSEITELAGVVKFFDPDKAWGFITPDNGTPDILLHVTCLREAGYQVAYEGAHVVVQVVQRALGPKAYRLVSMDNSTATEQTPRRPARSQFDVTPTSGLEKAQVKWFSRVRGYGYLSRGEGTPDIFVHMETLRQFGITELQPGQFVLVRFGSGPKGLAAAEVLLEGSTPPH